MKTITKPRPIPRRTTSGAIKSTGYGIKPRVLPSRVATVGDLRGKEAEFAKNADLDIVANAFESRSL